MQSTSMQRPTLLREGLPPMPSNPRFVLPHVHHVPRATIPSFSTRIAVRTHAAELEEIDPVTGDVLTGTISARVPNDTVTTPNGLSWAFRSATPPTDTPAQPQEVLLLHGLGSCSYTYRNTMQLLAAAGFRCWAPDWVGHGASSKPAPGAFAYDQAAYTAALEQLVEALPIRKPLTLVVHGFVLSQYALLWALANEGLVEKIIIINSPLAAKSQLRPELAAYKNPIAFLRPKADKPFDAMTFNAAGSPYAMEYKDAAVYAAAYEDSSDASVALATTMDKVDFGALCKAVDDGYTVWRKPALLVWGNKDPFIDVQNAFDFLNTKRTSMKMAQFTAKLGHMPQEDYAEAIHESIVEFLKGEEAS